MLFHIKEGDESPEVRASYRKLEASVSCAEILVVQGIRLKLYVGSAADKVTAELDFVYKGIGFLEVKLQFLDIFFV
jgi:hypothetical protein